MTDTYLHSYSIDPIGVIHSAFSEKFGIPRQPGLAGSIEASVELVPPYGTMEAVRGLEHCTHIWLLFIFSANADKGWKPTVRPPRLGGNKRLGVFASRSPFRPNSIGLSPVKLKGIRQQGDRVFLDVIGADLLDGTPIIDIKPYLPFADHIEDASYQLAEKVELLSQPVYWGEDAKTDCEHFARELDLPLAHQVEELLRCDPRPAYQDDPERVYGVMLHQLNIRFRIEPDAIHVLGISRDAGQK